MSSIIEALIRPDTGGLQPSSILESICGTIATQIGGVNITQASFCFTNDFDRDEDNKEIRFEFGEFTSL
jgi:hypothetical protein